MFQPGDLVVYGATGVCRVCSIGRPDLAGADRSKEYYCLEPLHQAGVIYAPVGNPKVSIRPVITREEANALIDRIPGMQPAVYRGATIQALTQQYQAAVHSHDCEKLVGLVMSIYNKQQQAAVQNRRLGMVDERYMKQAEQILHGELSAALDIPLEQVPAYIAQRVEAASV